MSMCCSTIKIPLQPQTGKAGEEISASRLNQLNLKGGVNANRPVHPRFPEFSRPVGGASLCLCAVISSLEFRRAIRGCRVSHFC